MKFFEACTPGHQLYQFLVMAAFKQQQAPILNMSSLGLMDKVTDDLQLTSEVSFHGSK